MTLINLLEAEVLLIVFSIWFGYNIRRSLQDFGFKHPTSKLLFQLFVFIMIVVCCVIIIGLMKGVAEGNREFPEVRWLP